MGKIVYLMGKSSSGKDTIYKRLLENGNEDFLTIVPYTTRPIRAGEQDGVEYFFTDEEGVKTLEKEGKIIELRSYETIHGIWKYMTVDDGQFDFSSKNMLMIGTLESFVKMKEYFGEDKLLPIMIDLEDGVRLERALKRERMQAEPKYEEMCRRFLADTKDFSKEKEREAGEIKHISNQDLTVCISEIMRYIHENG